MLRNFSVEFSDNFLASGIEGNPKAEIFMERKDGKACGVNGEKYIKCVSGFVQGAHAYPVSAIQIDISPGYIEILQKED